MTNDDMQYDEPEIIYIPDEEGNEEEFEVIMKFEVDEFVDEFKELNRLECIEVVRLTTDLTE